ncbi:Transcription elongation factor spt6 [Coniosporium apollinis]|uniref:Transcription elongation factor Spt6 n=1 Tax=Coniosporium apollinis TaxID=61459 RepID=A0ABQ9NQB4_9PEZI|nr:Transcription elongation factor spt6 [Coniosporium apollinis]
MSANLLIDDVAELGSEEDDEDFNDDEESGEMRRKTNGAGAGDDSSEEEDDDDDEEAAAKVREGFIVDEDEEEEEEDEEARRERKRKRKRRERAEEEGLDEEDVELMMENTGVERPERDQPKYKRLKRGREERQERREPRGVDEIFSDEEDALEDDRRPRHGLADDLDDFIEEDVFDDEEEARRVEDSEVARPARKGAAAIIGAQSMGLDEAALEDMRAAFGDGGDYDWALGLQEAMEDEQMGVDRPLELKDVFEPSQLVDKMLTDADNEIRMKDVPERFQIARKQFKEEELTEEEMAARIKEEALWISNHMLPKKRLGRSFVEPFQKSVGKVLEFMNIEDLEVPFIFQHRKDYFIHAARDDASPDPDDIDGGERKPERLFNETDLWDIFDYDLKFRAMVEKRDALQKTYENLKSIANVTDPVFEEMVPVAVSMEELQDIQEYLHFQYSAELKDVNSMDADANGTQKRARTGRTMFEQLRASQVYNLVRAFGITADSLAQNVLGSGHRQYTDDPSQRPDDMADSLVDPPDYSTGSQVLRAAKMMYIEELAMSPRMRKLMRQTFYQNGLIDCFRTEKGLRKITEDHPYYEFKYLRGQDFHAISRRPDMFLRMLKAESEGMVNVNIRLDGYRNFKERLYKNIESDNFSEAADAWNQTRREVLDAALLKLEKIITKGVKETLRSECEKELAKACRLKYTEKLDQAPYKPKGFVLGTTPRVLTLSNGNGVFNRDAICWAYVGDDGKVLENGKFIDLRLGNPEKYQADGKDVNAFVELVRRRKPDVIGVSGFSVETRRLYKDIQELVDRHDLATDWEDDDNIEHRDKIEVVIVNDEVARLYHTSDRAAQEHPSLAPLTRYCVALARYLQNPLLEYAALGKDIVSISFDPSQDLLPQDKLIKALDSAMIDMVNLVGVDVNDAVGDAYIANLVPYICGLGPRKAAQLLKVINYNGGVVTTRAELVGDVEKKLLAAVGPKVWTNCASFLYILFDPHEQESDYLDNTRVHPEDYDLGRKMAADALELDEEDVKAEIDEGGPAAVVRRLVKDDARDNVNDLVLEEYAEQLERTFNQKKRATLELIRAELQSPYEELRRNFSLLTSDEIFTMLTGETRESLVEGMIVPVQIRRTFVDHIDVRLDCGIEGGVSETEYPEGVGGENGLEPRQVFSVHQTVQAKLLYLNRKQLSAQLSFREDALRRPYRKELDRLPGEWDEAQEEQDKKDAEREKEDVSGRAQRVIKHPLFRPFNSAQAEEYLGSQGRGDVVIRPSSKGVDHLAVTWKISDNIYQHIDVLELDKDNEFSVGKTLKIGGKYTYSDLDELIVNHVKAMARKVDEMMGDEKYQNGSKAQTEQWLTTYTEANPKRSMYAFCINPKYPGYFYLCFKNGLDAPLSNWPVKVVPNAFELQKYQYPDMMSLKNGFKTLMINQMRGGARR